MNFDFIKPYPKLKVLYRHCQDAEELAVDYPAPSCASARNAIEFLVNFIYGAAVGEAPYKMTIYQKMKSPAFVKYLSDEQILGEMHSVRKMGNNGSHGHMLTAEEACDTLERLQYIVGDLYVSMGLIDDYPNLAGNG